jgi:hypothetical protein
MLSHRYDEAAVEIDQAKSDGYQLAYWHSILQLREHGDLARWAADVIALGEDYAEDVDPEDLFTAYLAIRDFAAAASVIAALPEPDMSGEVAKSSFFDKRPPQMLIYWFLGDEDRLNEIATETQQYLDRLRSSSGIGEMAFDSVAALVAAVLGDSEESKRLVRSYLRASEQDWTARALFLHGECATLGIAGAADAAVDCLRTGLEEPSFVLPFRDPYLPYYDGIRNDPAFVELLAELAEKSEGT